MALALAGCNNLPSTNTPEPPILDTSTPNNQALSDKVPTKCPPYNPEQTMCTAQYDPVCVKVKSGSVISYRTAGNACSACGSTSAVSYVQGRC